MSYVNVSSNSAKAASVIVTAPASIQDGDILVAACLSWKSGGGATITMPSGFAVWTERTSATFRFAIGWKRASSESGNYTFAGASATAIAAGIVVLRGRLASGDPLDVMSDTLYVGADQTVRAAAMDIATAASDIVWAGYVYNTTVPPLLVKPSAFTTTVVDLVFDDNGFLMAYLLDEATGSTGVQDGTFAAPAIQNSKHAFMVALKPAAASSYFFPEAFRTEVIGYGGLTIG